MAGGYCAGSDASIEPPDSHGRATRASGVDDVRWNAIGRILDLYSLQECANYFAACGYDAD